MITKHTPESLKAFTRAVQRLWEEKSIRVPVHLCGGNEKELIKIFKDIRPVDYVFSTHRNHYHALLKGIRSEAIIKELTGASAGSLCHGKAGSMCLTSPEHNFFSTGIVGANCAPAVGVGWAMKRAGKRAHVYCFVGDGAVDTGHFWEALRYALGWDLPVTFVVEDNDRSTCTSVSERLGLLNLKELDNLMNIRYYRYTPTYPHVGSGKYVQF